MKKAGWLALLVAGSAFAGVTSILTDTVGSVPGTVISAISGATTPTPGAGSPTPSAAIAPQVTLQDLVYFGTVWQMLQAKSTQSAIPLGGGFANPVIDRTSDGDFFSGTIEKLDGAGNVTDVILAFAGAQGADAVQAEALGQGIVLDEPPRAANSFEAIWANPRYAGAKIHVTGHSLGAGYTQYVMAEAVSAHGLAAVKARADFTGFGVPNLDLPSASHFGVDPRSLDSLFTGYMALNDPTNSSGKTDRVGVMHFLPAFTGLPPLYTAFNFVAAHWPTAYMTALGMPAWLGTTDTANAIQYVNDQFVTKNSYDPNYGPAGTLPLIVQGSASADTMTGMAGDDLIAGRGGADTLRGGPGKDRFLYLNATDSGPSVAAADEIADFAPGDRIDFSRMDANIVAAGTQAFTLVASPSFTAPGQLATWVSGGNTWVSGNIDADPAADFLIRIDGVHALTAADFVLVPQSTDQKLEQYIGEQNAILWPYVVGNPLIPGVPAI